MLKIIRGNFTREEVDKLFSLYKLFKEQKTEKSLYNFFYQNILPEFKELYGDLKDQAAKYIIESSLDLEIKKEILFNPFLYRYMKYIVVKDQLVLEKRNKYGLSTKSAVIKHLLEQDLEGRTSGCGCKICEWKHKRHYALLMYESLNHQAKMYDNMLTLVDININNNDGSSKSVTYHRYTNKNIDVFEHDFFRKVGTIFVKTPVLRIPSNKRTILKRHGEYSIGIIDKKIKLTDIEMNIVKSKNKVLDKLEKYAGIVDTQSDLINKLKKTLYLPF